MNSLKGAGAMRSAHIVVWLALAALTLAGCGPKSPSASEPPQESCPVMGMAPNADCFVDFQGKRIFFCCNECAKTFLANTEKYMKEMERKRVHLKDAPPISTPPVIQVAHPCACVPGNERPGLADIGKGPGFPFTGPVSLFHGTSSERARENPAKGTPRERAPPAPIVAAG